MKLYILSDKIRLDAFTRKKENLDEYDNVIFEEIITSLNKNQTTMRPPQLMDQAVRPMSGSDASSISNIAIRDQKSGNLILEFILNYFDFIYFLGLFQLIASFGGNTYGMKSLIELQNGLLASGHSSGEIKICDKRTKQCIGEWKAHIGGVNRLIQINNNNILGCSDDKTIRICDIKTNQSIGVLNGHEDRVSYISKLENGNIISASQDKTIKLWNVDTRECVETLKGHDGWVCCVIQIKN